MNNELPNPASEVLKETLKELPFTQKQIATHSGIAENILTDLKNGKRRFTAEYDLRLANTFGVSEGMFLGMQKDYDMAIARQNNNILEITKLTA